MSLGLMITQARIRAGLGIADLSAATNIPSALLKKMESNDFTNCGGEFYARGHLRTIASKVAVNPKTFLDAFEEQEHQNPLEPKK